MIFITYSVFKVTDNAFAAAQSSNAFCHRTRALCSLILSAIFLMLSGCGIYGGISEFKVDYSGLPKDSLTKNIKVETFTMDSNASVNEAIGTINVGSFSDDDLKKIRNSLENTVQQLNSGKNHEFLKVHVHFYKYILSFSNTRISGLAIVDWCVEEEGTVLYEEVIYGAYDSGPSILGGETLGSGKTKINKAIVKRITEKTFSLIMPDYQENEVEDIYLNLDSALAVLPESMSGSGGLLGYAISTKEYIGKSVFDEESKFNKVNWKEKIQAERARVTSPGTAHGIEPVKSNTIY